MENHNIELIRYLFHRFNIEAYRFSGELRSVCWSPVCLSEPAYLVYLYRLNGLMCNYMTSLRANGRELRLSRHR